MSNLFRMCSFWTGIIAVMFFVGDLPTVALMFIAQAVFFLFLSLLRLTERMYLYIFSAYLTVALVSFTYYTTFILVPGFE